MNEASEGVSTAKQHDAPRLSREEIVRIASRWSPRLETRDILAASLEGWVVYLEHGIQSRFFGEAIEFLDEDSAARATLMHLFLATFPGYEQERLMAHPDYFLWRVNSLVEELQPRHDDLGAYLRASRAVFCAAMRRLLARTTQPEVRRLRRSFLRATMQLSTSIDELIRAMDIYREYRFRVYPQLHSVAS